MDAATLEALRGSIAKWKKNAEAETPDAYLTDASDCPLCELFYWEADICRLCPVFQKTGRISCQLTPYGRAAGAQDLWSDDCNNAGKRKRAHAAALAEVAFLESLLPAEVAT